MRHFFPRYHTRQGWLLLIYIELTVEITLYFMWRLHGI
jgi:hypothetical protein